jgi:hypothetical protein
MKNTFFIDIRGQPPTILQPWEGLLTQRLRRKDHRLSVLYSSNKLAIWVGRLHKPYWPLGWVMVGDLVLGQIWKQIVLEKVTNYVQQKCTGLWVEISWAQREGIICYRISRITPILTHYIQRLRQRSSDSAVTGPVGIHYDSVSDSTLRQGGQSDHMVSMWQARKPQ